ncbi:peptide ABC transporter substrate-binding protein [Geosporobacter ferrireducens]|uniref:Peptide ABC transporter substrate-binding protein n=1 Tax=Geosporobacter ferrireducens TaxID=1424294 RepID=A0A1D8GQN5_9FIRM|nr:peptide ABC transporter substrate-binding protein [Geosporobacter ferrireducens]MTI55737.1 ABC transporter ATP-binding protein [Geosporobacter ferrireducens]
MINIEELSITFSTFHGKVHVLDKVSLSVNRREILAIVGESGSGKSVTAYSILGLLDKNAEISNGHIYFDEEDLTKLSPNKIQKYRGKRIGMVFQEPMSALHPTMRIGDQLVNVIKRHRKLSKKDAYPIMLDMLKDVHFDNPEDIAKKYPHQLSGGMRQRIVIALAMSGQPELLIADEPTTALDVTIQAEILNLIKELVQKHNTAVLLITHDLGVVKEVGDRVCVMYGGNIMESGSVDQIFESPRHPYTKALLSALPNHVDRSERLQEITGEIPDLKNRPEGCIFYSRCSEGKSTCTEKAPACMQVSEAHHVYCWEVHS